jgi:RimJ/RimL family protein N-acetyltransferase
MEPLDEAHYDDLLVASRPPEIWEWWPLDLGADVKTFEDWFARVLIQTREGTEGHLASIDAASGRAIGSTSFCTPRPSHRGVEIGWTWLTPAAWGTGVNAEAKLLMLRYAFEALGCIRVEFDTDEHNARSRRALEALPAHLDGVLRDWTILPDGRRSSSAYYSILDTEWPVVRANLQARVAARVRGSAQRG